MKKNEVLEKMTRSKLVSVIRIEDEDQSQEIIESIIQSGIKFIEITLTMENALTLISSLSRKYKGSDVYIGAGTVLDDSDAKSAIDAGALFIVGPMFSQEVSNYCKSCDILYVPGVFSPSDVYNALIDGHSLLKLFPASQFKENIVKELKGPFPNAEFMISGKVNNKNALEWLTNGASVLCLGSVLTNDKENIKTVVSEYLDLVK